MKIDKSRIIRTLIQSASGAGIALITALGTDFSIAAVRTAVIGFVSTVVISVLMNLEKQAKEQNDEEE